MHSLAKFFDVISRLSPGDPLDGKEEALTQLNPQKIYLENVRSLLGVSARAAQQVCDSAVRRGVFQKRVEVVCPDGSVAASAEVESALPEKVKCLVEEDGGFHYEEHHTKSLRKCTFYQFNG